MTLREDEFVTRIGKRLGALRAARNVRQQDAADRMGTALKNLQRIEAGGQNLTLRTIFRVCRAIGVSPEAAFNEDAEFLRSSPAVMRSSSPLPPRPVPVFRIAAAAGFARDGQLADVVGWAIIPVAVDERFFICRVEGDSMTPDVPAGSWNLFKRIVDVPTPGRIVLVELDQDELGGRYVVKRLQKAERRKGTLRLALTSTNDSYAPLVLESSNARLHIIAEHVEVVRAS